MGRSMSGASCAHRRQRGYVWRRRRSRTGDELPSFMTDAAEAILHKAEDNPTDDSRSARSLSPETDARSPRRPTHALLSRQQLVSSQTPPRGCC